MGCHCLLWWIFLTQGSSPQVMESPALQADSFPLSRQGRPEYVITNHQILQILDYLHSKKISTRSQVDEPNDLSDPYLFHFPRRL